MALGASAGPAGTGVVLAGPSPASPPRRAPDRAVIRRRDRRAAPRRAQRARYRQQRRGMPSASTTSSLRNSGAVRPGRGTAAPFEVHRPGPERDRAEDPRPLRSRESPPARPPGGHPEPSRFPSTSTSMPLTPRQPPSNRCCSGSGVSTDLGQLADPAPVIVHEPAYVHRGKSPNLYATASTTPTCSSSPGRSLPAATAAGWSEQLFTGWLDEIYASEWGQHWRTAVEKAARQWNDDWLQFRDPFSSRDDLSEAFDKLFEGSEAVLEEDAASTAICSQNTPPPPAACSPPSSSSRSRTTASRSDDGTGRSVPRSSAATTAAPMASARSAAPPAASTAWA